MKSKYVSPEVQKEINEMNRVIDAYAKEVRTLSAQVKVMRGQLNDVAKTLADVNDKMKTVRMPKGLLV